MSLEHGFAREHFDLLSKYSGVPRDENDAEQNAAYDKLKAAYAATEAWARALQAEIFPDGMVKLRKRSTSQANHFLPYNWARIYPAKSSPASLAYTVGIEGGIGFIVKIDTVQADSALRARYEELRGPTMSNESPVVAILPIDEGLNMRLEALVDWASGAVAQFGYSYDDAVSSLKLLEEEPGDPILRRFQGRPEFRQALAKWSEDQRDVFRNLASGIHEAGLDWWHTNITRPQVRFGRKERGTARAQSVLGYVHAAGTPKVRVNALIKGFEDESRQLLTQQSVAHILASVTAASGELEEIMPADEPRDGLWPNEIDIEDTDEVGRRFWIEKTIVKGRADREAGENALGRALWSPQRSKDGKNIYAAMTQVQPGDVIFHLADNEAITSVSVASEPADDTFIGLEGSDWADQPAYRIALEDFEELQPPLDREAFFETEPYATELRELAESGAKGLFYNRSRGLNQGAYLTEATPTLLSILNRAYIESAGKPLPYLSTVEGDDEPLGAEEAYTLDDALVTLFLERDAAEDLLLLWRAKQNVILQGPPGVGKSYAAHKLAYALMGAEADDRVGFVQFHQSYSYEDFVEGYRPSETGFELKPGKFVEFCRGAEADPDRRYVFIIDEINRGNLSKILGELMLLIESDKRSSRYAMPLASGKVPFHVPKNVFLLGLMNTADRSLAVVDYALRRRFAFLDLKPNLLSPKFRAHLQTRGVSDGLIDALLARLKPLNETIVGDTSNLGPGFAIGHSYFCDGPMAEEDETDWYNRVIRTEIAPLLREYWFDAPDKADQWREQLIIEA